MQDWSVFLSIISLCLILGVIGLWKKIPFMMMIGGAIIAFLAVIPMDFTQGTRVSELETVGNNTSVTWEQEPVEIEIYPKIFLGILGSMFMMAGALVWKYEEN